MKQKKAFLSTVLCTQKFRGLPKMVKLPFWYKKYKHINCLRRQLTVLCDLHIGDRLHPDAFHRIFGKYSKHWAAASAI